MAGSGKTTMMQRLNAYSHEHELASYIINLDPAVLKMPYTANIDIRDTVNYREVMKQYSLGPNGGIMTSLNLFATRFDQVSSITLASVFLSFNHYLPCLCHYDVTQPVCHPI
jgi:GTPase SAR1 family protein